MSRCSSTGSGVAWRWYPLALPRRWLLLLCLSGQGCALDPHVLDGRLCAASGECAEGYRCDRTRWLCVREELYLERGDGWPDAGDRDAGDQQAGDPAGGDQQGDPSAGDALGGDEAGGDQHGGPLGDHDSAGGDAPGDAHGDDQASGDAGGGDPLSGPRCGDGTLDSGEQCDDGNRSDGDGCSAACAVQFGWTCAGQPSDCWTTLWHQDALSGSDGFRPSQDFELAFDDYDCEAADDFVVPAGATWLVKRVAVLGRYEATGELGPMQSASIAIYDTASGLPGAPRCSYADVGVEPQASFELALPEPCQLPAGRYWLSVVAHLVHGADERQWFWRTQTVIAGVPAYWRNPRDGFASSCTSWQPLELCFGEITQVDLRFDLRGSR